MKNLERIYHVIAQIIKLDEEFAGQYATSCAASLQADGYFNPKKPWDFLIALGIMAWSIKEDSTFRREYWKPLRRLWWCLLRHPKWAMAAITPENLERYEKIAGQKLPVYDCWESAIYDSSGKDSVTMLLDYLNCAFISAKQVERSSLEQHCDDLPTVIGFYNLIASMERPPRFILERAEREAKDSVTRCLALEVSRFNDSAREELAALKRFGGKPNTTLIPKASLAEAKANLEKLGAKGDAPQKDTATEKNEPSPEMQKPT